MPYYANADQLYACFKHLFERLENEKPDAVKALTSARIVFRFRCTEPTAEIIINARRKPVTIDYGPTAQRADLDVDLAADTLHAILLGQTSLKKAVADKSLKVRGPIAKTLKLASLFEETRSLYPQVLREQGKIID